MSKGNNAKPLLEVHDLCIEFPTRRGVLTAVDRISFHIGPGEVLGSLESLGQGSR